MFNVVQLLHRPNDFQLNLALFSRRRKRQPEVDESESMTTTSALYREIEQTNVNKIALTHDV